MKKAKKLRSGILLFIMMISLALAIILAAVLIWDYINSQKEPIYKYASMSEEASARAYIWLNQIEDMPLSYTEIKEMMGDIQLELVLTPTEEKGKYMQALSDNTFAVCQKKAKDGLEKAYREVARHRLLAAGYEGEISDDMLDSLMREAYGISVAEYLSYCNVQLMPALEELTGMYSGEVWIEK